jgi:hypothetical protein
MQRDRHLASGGLRRWPPLSRHEPAAKPALPQDDADRGLDQPHLDGDLFLGLALLAQRPDLGDQALVDHGFRGSHGFSPMSMTLGG